MSEFKLVSKFEPSGDQPKAIKKLLKGLKENHKEQTLLGITGSGKTFTMANIIQKVQKPTLIISHNKTLAAQLYNEFREFFPNNAVHYFVSYYDYYQPEAYIPQSDTYIEKEATINEEIDRLRHASTQSLVNRDDVIIIASVSCIYGLGEKKEYIEQSSTFHVGQTIKRNSLLRELVKIQYERNDTAFYRGQFKVQGENIDIHLSTGETVIRITMFGDEIEKINAYNIKLSGAEPAWVTNLSKEKFTPLEKVTILPAKHFVTPEDNLNEALATIRAEMEQRVKHLIDADKLLEANRLERKTSYDLEMIAELGYCNGIENYSQHLTGRKSGSPPSTLIDFFPKDFLMFIDESHVTIPQVGGMYAGDQARKQTLVEFGFRLPSAKDNRPLEFKEFYKKINQAIYVSATPREFELQKSKQIVEQIIRPTGLLDPEIEIKPKTGQVQDLIKEIRENIKKKQRVLVTTITKRMSEDLSTYLAEQGIKVQYIHSEVGTMERVDILRDLREGIYDVLVGVNLLREGLDLPEVSLVAILDADIGGFLRTETSLIQTMGRAARHSEGRVIMYADRISPAMDGAMKITKTRRKKQIAHNKKHNITPKTTTAPKISDIV